jgi:hypothetical protein
MTGNCFAARSDVDTAIGPFDARHELAREQHTLPARGPAELAAHRRSFDRSHNSVDA